MRIDEGIYSIGIRYTLKLFPRINATEEEADLIEARLRTIFKQTMQGLHA